MPPAPPRQAPGGVRRNGPPEAVSRMRRTPAHAQVPSNPRQAAAKIALCSLSIGNSCAPLRERPGTAARHDQRFLVGQQHRLPARAAASRRQPGPPDDGRHHRIATIGTRATSTSASVPASTSVGRPSAQLLLQRACRCGIASTAARANRRHSASGRSSCAWAVNAIEASRIVAQRRRACWCRPSRWHQYGWKCRAGKCAPGAKWRKVAGFGITSELPSDPCERIGEV